MDKRLRLHSELEAFSDNLYFQPPSNIKLKYPCIIYNKGSRYSVYADDNLYLQKQQYSLMVVNEDPDDDTADQILQHFEYCSIDQYYTRDNLNHVTLSLYY